jgi:hypothetical protein
MKVMNEFENKIVANKSCYTINHLINFQECVIGNMRKYNGDKKVCDIGKYDKYICLYKSKLS